MFEILDHPADIGFKAFAETLPGLFENAALAMLSIRARLDDIEPRESYQLTATGSDYESLLVNWLSEVLYFIDGKQLAFRSVRVESLTDEAVSGFGSGEPFDPARHEIKVVVKAVTYHQLAIERTPEGWSARVYLDI